MQSSQQSAPSQTTLYPRPYRSALSQLRSGSCSSLKSFLVRMGWAQNDLSSSCGTAPPTTKHLFHCPPHPTQLSERDLWERPCLASNFLHSLYFFDLPTLDRSQPEPPPPSSSRVETARSPSQATNNNRSFSRNLKTYLHLQHMRSFVIHIFA